VVSAFISGAGTRTRSPKSFVSSSQFFGDHSVSTCAKRYVLFFGPKVLLADFAFCLLSFMFHVTALV
jgi:hypothetical protein